MSSPSEKWEAIPSKDEVKSIVKKAKPQKPKKMLHFTQQNGCGQMPESQSKKE